MMVLGFEWEKLLRAMKWRFGQKSTERHLPPPCPA
jgi:hypothetical protein